MFTRKQYMNKEVSHQDYYSQFADNSTRLFVLNNIGMDRLLKSEDESLNDIPLRIWDFYRVHSIINGKVKSAGDWVSLSTCVCIAKSCARQMIEEHNA